jgi:hypothetical protein
MVGALRTGSLLVAHSSGTHYRSGYLSPPWDSGLVSSIARTGARMACFGSPFVWWGSKRVGRELQGPPVSSASQSWGCKDLVPAVARSDCQSFQDPGRQGTQICVPFHPSVVPAS